MLTRRNMIINAAGLFLASGAGSLSIRPGLAEESELGPQALPSGARESAVLDQLSGKQALIKRSYRPPNYETPLSVFDQAFTPNDRFFVRWHLSDIPEADAGSWRLRISGEGVQTSVEVSLDQLSREFEQVELAALCHCSGNRRGLSDPHVMGVQWGFGAMGNARWRGVRLKDILLRAGLKDNVVEIAFNGGDAGVVEKTPDFSRSLPALKALDENTLIATHMNGESLPHWNGYPARLVVPGWTATYWIKQLVDINVLTKPHVGHWMSGAYRVPLGIYPSIDRFVSQETDKNTPITEILVNALITSLRPGQTIPAGKPHEVRGLAWDGGHGIAAVDVSTDAGQSWRPARLGDDLGRFSWRQWSLQFTPAPGRHAIMARATNSRGLTQVSKLIFNHSGYNNNLVQTVLIEAL